VSSKSLRKHRQRDRELAQRNAGGASTTTIPANNPVAFAQASVSIQAQTLLPSPEVLRQYDLLHPGFAERIFATFEAQANHRMELEKTTIHSDIRRSWGGLFAGLIVASLVIVLGFVAIMNSHDVAGSALSCSGLTGLVGTFVYGTRSKRQERLERAKLMTGKR
jgi:uncharacterized membrane protein